MSSFSSSITAAKKAFYNDNIKKLFFTFKTLLYLPPPATNLTSDTFDSFFTEKVAANRNQFNQLSMAHCFLHSPLSLRVRSSNS